MEYANMVRGTFLARPNRFVAHVEIGGRTEVVHVKNTGRCRELLPAGHIHAFCFFIVKGICEQQDMEIPLYIAVHTAVREVNIRIGF